jgi:hypothetical protein
MVGTTLRFPRSRFLPIHSLHVHGHPARGPLRSPSDVPVPLLPRSTFIDGIAIPNQTPHAPLSRIRSRPVPSFISRTIHPDSSTPPCQTFHQYPSRPDLLPIPLLSQRGRFLSLCLDLDRVLVSTRERRDERFRRRFFPVVLQLVLFLHPSFSLTITYTFPPRRFCAS